MDETSNPDRMCDPFILVPLMHISTSFEASEKHFERVVDPASVDLTFLAKDVGEQEPTILLPSLATLIKPLKDFEGELGLDFNCNFLYHANRQCTYQTSLLGPRALI